VNDLTQLAYIIAAVLFIIGLKMLGRADTARRGNLVSAGGMLLATGVILWQGGLHFSWILTGLGIGAVVGAVAALRVRMTSMPELVALLNGTGGLASLLVGWAEFHDGVQLQPFTLGAIFFAVVIGGVAFTGSVMAFAKLSERISGRPIMFPRQQLINGALLALTLVLGVLLVLFPAQSWLLYAAFVLIMLLALALGVLAVLPIGGADMPIVVSLLNSYSGIAASAAGFIIGNTVLIVAGALVGASGLILTQIMCKSMNRSLANVLFSGFGSVQASTTGAEQQGEVTPITPEDAYYVLEAASNVIFVPGYGMAVAQAQHAVKELADLLSANGANVRFAIHPVAGRMPGHMNVLLAEANVPYEQLVEPGDVNPTMDMDDVAIVIGANDVVNPAAREDPGSPLYGMPIINVDEARTVFVLKRSMKPGFAGVENPLFYKPNTRMLFGDAKETVSALVGEFKDAAAG
jgi:NAD(P) transhydrogenase subunit beta